MFWWLVRLRWIAVLGIALVLGTGSVLDILPAGTFGWLWGTVAALLGYNALLAHAGPRRGWSWLTQIPGQLAIDCLALATFVHLGGGIDNPFLMLFVLHVVTANIALSGRAALGVLGLAIALVSVIVLAEGGGLLDHHCLWQSQGDCAGGELDARALGVLFGLVLTLVASSQFTRFLTSKLRAGQRKLLATVGELAAEKDELATTRAAIETQRARLQAIIDCMADAVSFVSPDGTPLFSNDRARQLWRAEAPPPDLTAAFERDGRAFEAIRSKVTSVHGEELGIVIVVRDVTERHALEKHLMHEERMSVVGKLAATVAHEINNPIGVVSLYSQHALKKLSPDSPVYSHLETIRRSAEGCRSIVGNLLKLARAPKPERRQVDLHELCREVRDSVQPLAARRGVRLATSRVTSDAPIWAHADAGMLHQAILNLALNAIEAAGDGDEVSVYAHATDDGEPTIEVRDSGPGIAPADLEQIFQPFFTTKATGTGLGLSIADNIVKSHDGRIEVRSGVGTGTLFRIVMPPQPPSAAVERVA